MKDTILLVLEKQFARISYPGQQPLPLHYFKTSGRPKKSANQKLFLRRIPHLSFPSLPNSFTCLITRLLLPAPKFYVAMPVSHSLVWLCYSQAQSQPQRASTTAIYCGRGFLFSVNLLSVYTWHLVARSQVHC